VFHGSYDQHRASPFVHVRRQQECTKADASSILHWVGSYASRSQDFHTLVLEWTVVAHIAADQSGQNARAIARGRLRNALRDERPGGVFAAA
jgi:hypothetical protein